MAESLTPKVTANAGNATFTMVASSTLSIITHITADAAKYCRKGVFNAFISVILSNSAEAIHSSAYLFLLII